MKALDTIKHTLQASPHVIEKYLEDLSDAEILERPVPLANHIAFQLGHLVLAERLALEELAVKDLPELPKDFSKNHQKDNHLSDNPEEFSSKDIYLALLKVHRQASIKYLENLTEKDLDREGPLSMRSYAPTLGLALNMNGIHSLMHVGQISVLRRKLEKPIAI